MNRRERSRLVEVWRDNEKSAKYFLAAIVESSQDSIVSIDVNRIVTSWNKGAEILYGYTADEVIGKSLGIVMLPKDIQDLIEKVANIKQEVFVPIYETVRMHKSGKSADLQIALSPVRNSEGEVIGISTIARDITESKLQEQLKDEFIAVASHELKTPVTSIRSYSELLIEHLKDSDDTTALSFSQKLNMEVERMVELLRTLLDTTKLSGGEVLLHMVRFDIGLLIQEQIEVLQRISPQYQIRVEGDAGSMVIADRKLIGQAITNLLTNAVRYSPDGGKIIASIKQNHQKVEVSVQDFGIGIPADMTSKIFERYFRVKGTPKATASGIGLGLYITAQIVRQHGGEISVESQEEVGSTFSFTLPLNNEDKSEAL